MVRHDEALQIQLTITNNPDLTKDCPDCLVWVKIFQNLIS